MAIQEEEGSNSNWEGMLKRWSLDQGAHHVAISTGSVFDHPANSGGTHRTAPKLRGDAQKYFMKHKLPLGYDIADRVYEIGCYFPVLESETEGGDDEVESEDESESESEDESESESESESEDEVKMKEDLLDELQAYLEYVDVVKVLFIDDLLYPLLHHVLDNNHAGIRAKGAEVVTAMVKNNPTGQQLVIKEKGLQLLLHNFTSDSDATSRAKALGAISSLIRNNKPGITAFRLANGYASLTDALSSECVRFQREALNLIQYLLHENSSDCNIVTELGLPHIMMHLASSEDLEVREAALMTLLVLARDEGGGNSGQLVKNDDKLKQILQERIEGIIAMAPEDLGAAREERQLVDSLWNACYNEPSSLGEKGLLVLPGEDAPAPAPASKLFEPSRKKEQKNKKNKLRACSKRFKLYCKLYSLQRWKLH